MTRSVRTSPGTHLASLRLACQHLDREGRVQGQQSHNLHAAYPPEEAISSGQCGALPFSTLHADMQHTIKLSTL